MTQHEQEPTVECALHGRRRMTFVCTHIAHGLVDGATPGFVVDPDDDHTPPMAWCMDCETETRGDWDRLSAAADFKMLCEDCYAEAKGLAVSAGRFRDLRSRG